MIEPSHMPTDDRIFTIFYNFCLVVFLFYFFDINTDLKLVHTEEYLKSLYSSYNVAGICQFNLPPIIN